MRQSRRRSGSGSEVSVDVCTGRRRRVRDRRWKRAGGWVLRPWWAIVAAAGRFDRRPWRAWWKKGPGGGGKRRQSRDPSQRRRRRAGSMRGILRSIIGAGSCAIASEKGKEAAIVDGPLADAKPTMVMTRPGRLCSHEKANLAGRWLRGTAVCCQHGPANPRHWR